MPAAPDALVPAGPIPGLVSVVMPAHNEADYIAEAVATVQAQSYADWELIVVDDGSTDATAAIAAELGADVIHQRHRGEAAARNAGLARARGEYWTICDADDLLPPDRLRHQVTYLRDHPDQDAVMGLTEAFTTPGQAPPAHWNPAWSAGPFPACLGTLLCRRSLLARVGGYDETVRIGSDFEWVTRALDSGARVGQLQELCLRYRIHPGNASADRLAVNRTQFSVLRARTMRKRASRAAS